MAPSHIRQFHQGEKPALLFIGQRDELYGQKLNRAVPSTLRGAPGTFKSGDVPWPEMM